MTKSTAPTPNSEIKGHLDFYLEEGISPVRQDISDLGKHLSRREALYRSMGLLPITFRDRRVLEVGPGSGDNSLFIATCMPSEYDLLEPNPVAVEDIKALYEKFELPHRQPTVIPKKLQDFDTDRPYDVILCEGWLGGSEGERQLLKKLSRFVAPGGVMVLSFLPPTGAVATLIRRMLAYRILPEDSDLKTGTELLTSAFGSHLSTLTHMSRAVELWLQDNILNPALLAQLLTPGTIAETLGQNFGLYGCNPRLFTDWRWYKSVSGKTEVENTLFLETFDGHLHNLVDFRFVHPARDLALNRDLEQACLALYAVQAETEKSSPELFEKIATPQLRIIRDNLEGISPETAAALNEALELLQRPTLNAEDIAGAQKFAGMFGREMCYLAATRTLTT